MRFFSTETGSEYQVDARGKRLRRLGGHHVATRNQGVDGAWQDYETITPDPPRVGQSVMIVWRTDTEPLAEGVSAEVIRRTQTSPIKFLSEEN